MRLDESVAYTGAQALTIIGKRSTIDASALAGSALIANGGADLTIEDLTIQDAGGEGLEVQIPTTATGTITVVLRHVTALRNAGHGVLINDQEQTETTDGVQPNGNGSAAALVVQVENVRFAENGYSVSDRDGLRINEGGAGDLTFTAINARSEDNAADGIELDERGTGSIFVDVRDTWSTCPESDPARAFAGNAAHLAFGGGRHFCLGAVLSRFEIEFTLGRILDALPDLRLADDTPPPDVGLFLRGPASLPVCFSKPA